VDLVEDAEMRGNAAGELVVARGDEGGPAAALPPAPDIGDDALVVGQGGDVDSGALRQRPLERGGARNGVDQSAEKAAQKLSNSMSDRSKVRSRSTTRTSGVNGCFSNMTQSYSTRIHGTVLGDKSCRR